MKRCAWPVLGLLIVAPAVIAADDADNLKPDPEAAKGDAAHVEGLWLTNLGLMDLSRTDATVGGRYALMGTSSIDGTLAGRHLEFTFKSFRRGKGWLDFAADGETFTGAAIVSGAKNYFAWKGRRASEFALHVKLVAGKIVDGSTRGLLTYSIRAPESYKDGDTKKWPTILILHGSNMSGRAYVNTIATTWPAIAKDYMLLGINGEQPSDISKGDPRFNYTYVDFVGKSTYKGFPGTDRESPALVAEAMTELREAYPLACYFVGGHSQGGFLTYSLLMNFPEQIAGAFPISAGVIFQCEPKAYDDEKLKVLQRAVPLAIIHSKQDPVVNFSLGDYAAKAFQAAGWKSFRFFADSPAGHQFGLLPVDQAIRWLESKRGNK